MHPGRSIAPLLLTAFVLLIPAGCAKKDGLTDPRTGPTADFSADPRSGGTPLDVTFIDRSSPGASEITSTLWSFGDGASGTDRNATHRYGAAGTYTVSLTVSTAKGTDTESKADFIVVGSGSGPVPPTAAFTANRTAGQPPLNVQFTDQSTSGSSAISAWSWNFGDGGTSSQQSPSHTYAANGSYDVSLTVTTTVGADTEKKTDYIVVSSVAVPPTAQFSGNPTTGSAPLTVQFTDQSVPGTSPITSRYWTFGDGEVSSGTNPSHIYASSGTYTVSLQVTSADGQDTVTKTSYVRVCQLPVADFEATPTSGLAPLSVQFTNRSTPTSGVGWAWDFGDGSTSTARNPSHVYLLPGTYTVTLTASNACGSDVATKVGYVRAGP